MEGAEEKPFWEKGLFVVVVSGSRGLKPPGRTSDTAQGTARPQTWSRSFSVGQWYLQSQNIVVIYCYTKPYGNN